MLLRSGRGYNKAIYQEMLAALRPLTPLPPLKGVTVLILPDCYDSYEEITRGMFEQFEVVVKAGVIRPVHILFPGVNVLIRVAMSDK